MANHPMFSDDMADIVETFIQEAQEILEELNNQFLGLEADVSNKALLDEIFRAVHTLKGSAGIINHEQLNYLSHQLEEVLNLLRRGSIEFSPEVMDAMIEGSDLMRHLVDQVIDEAIEPLDLSGILHTLETIAFTADREAEIETEPVQFEPEANDLEPVSGRDEMVLSFSIEVQTILGIVRSSLDQAWSDKTDLKPFEKISTYVHILIDTSHFVSLDSFSDLGHQISQVIGAILNGTRSTDEETYATLNELLHALEREVNAIREPQAPATTLSTASVDLPETQATSEPGRAPEAPETPVASATKLESVDIATFSPSPLMLKEANTQLADPDMEIVVEAFLGDADNLVDIFEKAFPLGSNEHIAALFGELASVLKSVRNGAGFLSIEQLTALARNLELSLDLLSQQTGSWEPAINDVLYHVYGQFRLLIEQVRARNLQPVDLRLCMTVLEAAVQNAVSPSLIEAIQNTPVEIPLPADAPEEAPEPQQQINVGPDHPLYSDEMKEIVESFVVETGELFEILDNKLIDLETQYENEAFVNEIFRSVHTIKGSAGFLSLEQLYNLTHQFEDVLNQLRRGKLAFESSMMDVMFEAFDLMKILMQQVVEMQLEIVDTSAIIQKLKAIARGQKQPDIASRGYTESPKARVSTKTGGAASKDATKRHKDRSSETIRVEVGRLDSLMNLVGELVLSRNRLVQIIDDISLEFQDHDELHRSLLDTSAQLDFITTELQTGVMHTRMVQVGRVFNKFPRVVRDLAKDAKKQIDLVIEGADTELDKSLTEEIGDPLVHLIRNSVDHGIEPPHVRVENGKPPIGTIRLSAQHEGNNIVIEIEDDGHGIDPEKLKRKAIEKGLISEKEAAEMNDTDAYNLIFKPGFSTADKVTKISGRGVGMDVVKTNIAHMNGTISINSDLGKGTVITLKLPLTLAINQSLLIKQGSETFAIPLHSVIEVVGLEEQRIDTINGREVIRIRERILPLVRIGEVLDIPSNVSPDKTYAVVVGLAHHRIGLVADDLVGQKEIVIKPLGNYLKKVTGIAGSTILGDGHVIMILDVGELIRVETERNNTVRSYELEAA